MGQIELGSIPEEQQSLTLSTEQLFRINSMVEMAKNDAIERTDGSPEAVIRVTNAIERRFRPYITENQIIAEQITSPEYQEFVQEINAFLGGRIAAVQCDDGRITLDQIGDARVMQVGRRLQGLPNIRTSTKNRDQKVLQDPTIVESISIYHVRQRREGNDNPFTTEFVGPHIFSTEPMHGCGAEIAKIRARGGVPDVDMWDGGINDYYNELGEDGFQAFNNHIELLKGSGETFDMVHDAHSQGLIFGLKEARKKFDPNLSLRENLIALWKKGDILITEQLDSYFKLNIYNIADKLGFTPDQDFENPNEFAKNTILLGKTAMELTKIEEEKGFNWIPQKLKDGKDPRAIRALGYVAMRNSVRRVLNNIVRGNHRLTEHPEQLIVIGPISSDNNPTELAFIHHIPKGVMNEKDVQDIEKLNGLLEGSLRQAHGANFNEEGKVILTTGELKRIPMSVDEAEEAFEELHSTVGENAARIRERFSKGVEKGEVIVLGGMLESQSRNLAHIVT